MNTEVDLNSMEFTDLQDIYQTRCEELGKEPSDAFKTKEALIGAINALQDNDDGSAPTGNGEAATSTNSDGSKQAKYDSSGKRGPNQGIGAFAKEQIAAGKTNQEILDMITTKFPTARTSTSCIAYYRNAVKKGGSVKGTLTPEALRAKAKEMLERADALEKAQKEAIAKGGAEAQARAELQAQIDAMVAARVAEIKKQQEEAAAAGTPPADAPPADAAAQPSA